MKLYLYKLAHVFILGNSFRLCALLERDRENNGEMPSALLANRLGVIE